MRVLLSSGAEITGVDPDVSVDGLRDQLDELRDAAGWLKLVRTAKEHGLTLRETVYVRADQVIGLIDEEYSQSDAGAAETPSPVSAEVKR